MTDLLEAPTDQEINPEEEPASEVPPSAAADAGVGSKKRTLPILAAVAVLSLAAGFGLSHFVVNPADAAARTAPPAAGLITVPIENRELSNDVTIRGDVLFDGASDVTVDTAEMGMRAIVTGHIPEVGAELVAGSVALEIGGRPVILLPGGLPTFRTLRVGDSGPDVVQLREALAYLGISTGSTTSDVFDAALATGITELYRQVGFPTPPVPDGVAAEQEAARAAVRMAEENVTRAQTELNNAGGGPSQVEITAADAAVNAAVRDHGVAVAAQADHEVACEAEEIENCATADFATFQAAVDNAADAITVAQAARAALNAPVDTSAARDALNAARQGLTNAQEALQAANEAALPFLPASEVVFLDTLPRRVDHVAVRRGETVGGAAIMSVSGAELKVTASAAAADRALLEVGDAGIVDAGELTVDVTIAEIGPADAATGRSTITFALEDLTAEEVVALRGRNVRITIPVSATGGAVLTVPLAALTAGPGGEARIEIQETDGTTSLVEVTTGLAAGGHVEIEGVGRDLRVGDLVVIGQGMGGGQGDSE
ncbi:MAG: hypothetical protein FWD83_01065 [Promicromonosporaceae bacterium]|nr:hypothetical protein [Promicromonosporaceae bacterium]